MMGPLQNVAATNVGEITIELVPAETRSYAGEQIGALWRDATDPIPEAVELSFDMSVLNVGDDVDLQLTGSDIDRLRAAAEAVKRRLAQYSGVYAIADSFRSGTLEMHLDIEPTAENLGLRLGDLGRQVRQAFYGEEAQRIQRGRDDIRVMLRYRRDDRRSLGDLEDMRIRTPEGGEVPFGYVARGELVRGFASITRVDRNRTVNVTASVDPAISSPGPLIADLEARVLPELLMRYPGVTYTFQGAQAEQTDAIGGLLSGFVIALLLIFALLAIPLRSYGQPLIIMAAIPFGLVGAIWGHIIMGIDVTLVSMLGLVALTGVVVNDSLVMGDFINHAQRVRHRVAPPASSRSPEPDRGPERFGSTGLHPAIREAGGQRFRPIVLTSLTTFVGLAPLMFERSMQAMFLVPMAVSLAFGVLFATFITLILVPTAYLILDDAQEGTRRLFAALGADRTWRSPSSAK